MFEEFKKIQIEGGYYEPKAELSLFKNDAVSVVYGRNGSGKTTIAKCIADLALPEEERNSEYTVQTDVLIELERDRQIAVFDEDFPANYVKFRNEGMQTIVMLGEAGMIDLEISAKEAEEQTIAMKVEKLKAIRNEYDDSKNMKSPLFHLNELYRTLKEDDGWADKVKEIKGYKQRPKVNEELLETFMTMKEPAESYEKLNRQLIKEIEVYKESEDAKEIVWECDNPSYPDSTEYVEKILKQSVEKPWLSSREERLLDFMVKHPHSETHQLLVEKWEFCPVCLREIGNSDRADIKKILTQMLNKEAENYKVKLADAMDMYGPVSTILPEFPGSLNQKELSEARQVIEELNSIAEVVCKVIIGRLNDIYGFPKYSPFEYGFVERFKSVAAKYNSMMKTLKRCVNEFNSSVKKREELREKILNDNMRAAKKRLSTSLDIYIKAKEESKNNAGTLATQQARLEGIRREINNLKEKIARTDIALDYINEELGYVFYSDRKLKLEAGVTTTGEKVYKLKVNGKNVKPEKISVGERNVLALCYFFAKIFSNKKKEDEYKDEYLIVLDDPVSSFDYGNRVGIMTLLRYQFNNIVKGNSNSRILVMSHDLHTVFDLMKIRNEVCEKTIKKNHFEKVFFELKGKRIQEDNTRNEYRKLLEQVYMYAADEREEEYDESMEMSIGNIMRRMMEAFSSFCYNKNFEKMVRDEHILVAIPPMKRVYYENLMSRLVLNGESHMEEGVYSLETMANYFTRTEKQETAKCLLLFLYYVNKAHLVAYLNEDDVVKIEGWMTSER